jgi:hypothetical protein
MGNGVSGTTRNRRSPAVPPTDPDPLIVGSGSHVIGRDDHILGKTVHPEHRRGIMP